MMTSGLTFAIHCFENSKPLNTGAQYAVSVLPRSHAAPMAGTCEQFTLATILAPVLPDLLRLPSTERPPSNIMCAYCSCVDSVMMAATCSKERPSEEKSFERK